MGEATSAITDIIPKYIHCLKNVSNYRALGLYL